MERRLAPGRRKRHSWNEMLEPNQNIVLKKKKKQGRVEHIYFIEKKLKAKIKEKS